MKTAQSQWNLPEKAVTDLLNKEKDFRREWALFAARSGNLFTDFRDKGASLSKEFWEQVQKLESGKQKLFADIADRTKMVPENEWICPPSSAALHDLEVALEGLRDLCRTQEKKRRDWVSRMQRPLHAVELMSSMSKDVSVELRKAGQQMKQLAEELDQSTDGQTENLSECVDAALALLELTLAFNSSDDGEHTPLSLDQCTADFDKVESCFGRLLAIAAMRGDLRLPPGFRLWEMDAPVEAAEKVRPVHAAKLSKLENHFNNSHDQVAEPKTIRRVHPVRRSPVTAKEAAKELKSAVDGLKNRALLLRRDHQPDVSQPGHITNLRATGYENLSRIAAHLVELLQARDESGQDLTHDIESCVNLLAEAQNAVRSEAESRQEQTPQEQNHIFLWLKSFVSEDAEGIHVRKYMRLEDVASAQNNPNLAERIGAQIRKWKHSNAAEKTLGNIRQLAEELSTENFIPTLGRLDLFVRQYLDGGPSPSDSRLREALIPGSDLLPDPAAPAESDPTVSQDLTQVLKYLHEHLLQQSQKEAEAEAEAASAAENAVTAELSRVREWLSGQSIALLAGTPKPEHAKRIEDALQLKSLNWIGASKTDRVSDLISQIGDAKVVVMVTKLMGHKHNDIKDYCIQNGIPYAQTKKTQGYGVNTLVSVIIDQVSDQLDRAA